MTEIDADTGFPKLPEGYYWHVMKSGMGSPYAYISIRKDFLRWGLFTSSRQYLEMICTQHEIRTAKGLRKSVHEAWTLYGAQFRERVTPVEIIDPYGSYPPKKLP
jgi:hypothetical protein